ncbi:MFS general substrate transporter [Lichtheimia hyalospora FSU 10163]|nr:MFS general substrate transporter [Lichtheimia hyalospora FSU 10163]
MANDHSSPAPSDDGGNGTVVSSIHSKQENDMQHDPPKSSFLSNLPPWTKKLQLGIVYFGLFLTMFMIAIQATVIAPAMTKIATDMDDVGNQTWIATAYLIGMISLQPLAGKFSDIFGRKPMVLMGLFFFVAGSLISALVPTMNGFIAGRAISGVGGGSIMACMFIIATDITPMKFRPRINSALSGMYGLSSVVGPLIGGAFVDFITWRWDFWLNIILGGVSFIILAFFFRESSSTVRKDESLWDKIKRIDAIGTILVIATIACLLCALNWGPMYGWGDGHAIGTFVASGVSFILLIIVETRVAKEPILPPKLLKNPKVLVFYFYICCLGLGFVGTLFYGPITFQAVFGADSTQSGIRLMPYMGALILGAIGGGQLLQRYPYPKFYIMVGSSSALLGFGLFQLTNEHSNWGFQAGFFAFSGLGFGLSQQNTILAVQTVADKEYMAIATALVNFALLLAPSIGLAVYQAIFSAFIKAQFSVLPAEVLEVANRYGVMKNYLYIRNLPVEYQPPVIHAYMEALSDVFIPPIVAAGIAVILAVLAPNVRFGGPRPPKSPADQDIEASKEKQDGSSPSKEETA